MAAPAGPLAPTAPARPVAPRGGEPFETETMAELCARQGRLGEAIAIFERLLAGRSDAPTRQRWNLRLEELRAAYAAAGGGAATLADLPIPSPPGVLVQPGDDEVLCAWALPGDTRAPALDVLLVFRTPSGIETTHRTVALESTAGRMALPAAGLHSCVAAAGRLIDGRFVPMARSPRG